jgi:Protein of unknown function (DUF1553)/Protein of unknown function (DUF1549)
MMPRFSFSSWSAVSSLILPLILGVSAASAAEPSFHHGDWPFNTPTRPARPNIANQKWAINPLDQFVAARLEAAGLQPNAATDKTTLLRRVTYDLTGLPPTTAELDAFLADTSDDAYARVVNRLLASPRFGERWAQHWLDLVRYAETDGFKADQLRPNAYRYRDYVIDSFNRDRPFDEFIRQQIAGDELEPDNPDALIATGFLRLYADEDNAANLFQRRQEILDDITDTTGLVFLGLTMGCAQCHDHKFDDIPQTDYFRLQAFFASLSEHNDCNIASTAEVATYEADMARWQEATATIRADIDKLTKRAYHNLVEYALEKYEPSISSCYRKPPSERTPLEEQIARMVQWRNDRQFAEKPITEKLSPQDKEKYAALTKQLAEFDSLKPKPLPHAMAVSDVGRQAPPTHLLEGGSWKRPAAEISPGFPQFLGDAALPATKAAHPKTNQSTTGRRTQLAEWLTRPDHPLTSRIIVNRLWQQHFGRGIVATPSDFGMQGERPTHPELLDWLAIELVENGWSLKHIHRLMVMSATYRQASLVDRNAATTALATKVDPENKLLWHANRRRLEGEQIRDAMLQIAGQLNLTMHGPSARPKLPAGVSERYAWKPDKDPAQRNRRSVYILAKRNMRFPLFEAFDQPDLHQSCPRRAVTITAPQSLAMLNSELTLDLANDWAERLAAEHADSERDLIEAAIQSAFCRAATEKEIELASKFVADEIHLASKREGQKGDPRTEAVAAFCHALFNANEFISID